jgi:hypothetical protein
MKRIVKTGGSKLGKGAAAPVTDAEARAAFDVLKACRLGQRDADHDAAQAAMKTFNRYVTEQKAAPRRRTFTAKSPAKTAR